MQCSTCSGRTKTGPYVSAFSTRVVPLSKQTRDAERLVAKSSPGVSAGRSPARTPGGPGDSRPPHGPCLALLTLASLLPFEQSFFTTLHWIAIFLTRNKLKIRACCSHIQFLLFSVIHSLPFLRTVWFGGHRRGREEMSAKVW